MRLLTVIGARPQFVKAAVVSAAFARRGVDESILHTGQHFDDNMSAVFFDELGLRKPRYNLGVGGGGHGQNTGRMLEGIEAVLLRDAYEVVLVYGDTDSTLAGALAASKLHIPVAHVEAGLRSFNRRMPEELNRVVTDHLSSALFVPTQAAVSHLAKEGIVGSSVVQVGDVMFDAALHFADRAASSSEVIKRLKLEGQPFVLATVHRAENADNPERLAAILHGFGTCSLMVVLPLHPRARARIRDSGLELPQNVMAIDPVGYLDMVMLTKAAKVVATDSGGLQKEAFFHGVPCVTLRDETEWMELVESGWNRIVPPSSADAVASSIQAAVGSTGSNVLPYGDGHASERIADTLIAMFS
ncbi:MAG: UDP-N-acetylglucosamine 2-epimerase (non-hydrolyzing) [Gemmatimonadota bacterium]|nr:UDP-N-acetylglucosamine 2-epimerase (non-hydrolyzing) [Gemmatimonadota bacterium]